MLPLTMTSVSFGELGVTFSVWSATLEEPELTVFTAGPLTVDLMKHEVRVAGALVALSRREFDLLAMLARNPGRMMTHRQLLVGVWGPAHVEDVQYLRVYIGQLRHKLGAASELIATEPGIGYRLREAG